MRAAAPLIAAVLLAGCQYPRDVDGTLDRVTGGGTLRVGVTEEEPYVVLDGPRPRGVEVRLVEDFARERAARIRWVRGNQESLVEQLRGGELDVAIGGFTARNPLKKEAAPTRPYAVTYERMSGESKQRKHVMYAKAGENALLVALERYLLNRKEQIRRMLDAEGQD